jgi:hypothetical protein
MQPAQAGPSRQGHNVAAQMERMAELGHLLSLVCNSTLQPINKMGAATTIRVCSRRDGPK